MAQKNTDLHVGASDLVAQSHVKNQLANALGKKGPNKTSEKKLSVDDLVRESMKSQPDMLQAYPTMP